VDFVLSVGAGASSKDWQPREPSRITALGSEHPAFKQDCADRLASLREGTGNVALLQCRTNTVLIGLVVLLHGLTSN
jgi:hypothetical protein